MVDITVAEALAYSVLGFAIVFLGLILLMAVIKIMAAIMGTGKKKQAAASAPAPAAEPAAPKAVAPGSAGEIKLYDVPDKEAAMIMAIVANKMQKPLNELRFKSIKEVK
jgi:sodium pump decarboxylase gamma subunit